MESTPEITVAHVAAVHAAAQELDTRIAASPRDSGRYNAAVEAVTLLRQVEQHLLEQIPESQRAPYLHSLPLR
jgi:hypothetical protein